MQLASVGHKAGRDMLCAIQDGRTRELLSLVAVCVTFSSHGRIVTTMPTRGPVRQGVNDIQRLGPGGTRYDDTRSDSGDDRMTISVLRQLPKGKTEES